MSSSNKHEPIARPEGTVGFSQDGAVWGPTFRPFINAADKLFADLAHLNSLPHSVERETKAEHVQTAISAMYATVELLGIEPLVVYLAGRMEQADLDVGCYEIERKVRP